MNFRILAKSVFYFSIFCCSVAKVAYSEESGVVPDYAKAYDICQEEADNAENQDAWQSSFIACMKSYGYSDTGGEKEGLEIDSSTKTDKNNNQ